MKKILKITAIIVIHALTAMNFGLPILNENNAFERHTLGAKTVITLVDFQERFSQLTGIFRQGNSLSAKIAPSAGGFVVQEKNSDTGILSLLRNLWDAGVGERKSWVLFFTSFIIASVLYAFNGFNPVYAGPKEMQNPGQQITAEFVDDSYTVELIPGTGIEIHTHCGQKEGRHNNVLGDWAQAIINGILQPEADIIRFDWHADDKALLIQEQEWRSIQEMNDQQLQILTARNIAAYIRIDAFNYPAYLTGPTGIPILKNTIWVRQENEWQGTPKEQTIVFLKNIMLDTETPELYPDAKKLKRYILNIKDLLSFDTIADIKDGFVLDFDLDFFALERSDINWNYMKELLASEDEADRKIALLVLREGYFRSSREEIQKKIDLVLEQLAELAEKGKMPAIITIADSPGFTPQEDVDWIRMRLVEGLKMIYGEKMIKADKDKIRNRKGKEEKKKKDFSELSAAMIDNFTRREILAAGINQNLCEQAI